MCRYKIQEVQQLDSELAAESLKHKRVDAAKAKTVLDRLMGRDFNGGCREKVRDFRVNSIVRTYNA